MTEINISKVIADNGNAEGTLIITLNVDKVSDLENLFGPKNPDPTLEEFKGKPLGPLEDTDQPLPQAEAEKFLGVTRQFMYNMRRKGRLKAYKLGGKVMFYKKDLIALLEEC